MPADPIAEFQALFARALQKEPDATAMALATSDATGAPSVRMVLLKGVDASGFVFFTNYESRKARELAANPRAALCLYWPTLGVQVRVEGEVEPVTAGESDAYFTTRPRESQLGAWASAQSQPLPSPAELRASFDRISARFAGQRCRDPTTGEAIGSGPQAIEIWTAGEFRLHDRVLIRRTARAGRSSGSIPDSPHGADLSAFLTLDRQNCSVPERRIEGVVSIRVHRGRLARYNGEPVRSPSPVCAVTAILGTCRPGLVNDVLPTRRGRPS